MGKFPPQSGRAGSRAIDRKERQVVYRAFAPKNTMRIFGRGIRRRLASMLCGDRRRIELAFSLLFTLSGTPVIIYGDEIGLGEDLSLEGRNAVRVPMQWSSQRNGGFSTAPAGRLVKPVVSKGTFSYERVNVADQERLPDSLLNRMKRLIAARRQCPEWGWGRVELLETGAPGVLAHRCEWNGITLLAVHNLAKKGCDVTLRVNVPPNARCMRVQGSGPRESEAGIPRVRLGAYEYAWYRIRPE